MGASGTLRHRGSDGKFSSDGLQTMGATFDLETDRKKWVTG